MRDFQASKTFGLAQLSVGPVIFGSASIGGLYQNVSYQKAHSTLQAAWNSGIRCFDTAPEYGKGLSERRLGDFLRIRKEDSLLCTKTGEILQPGAHHNNASKFVGALPFHRVFDFSGSGIRRSLEDSLQRMGIDRVDLLLIHDLDPICLQQDYGNHYRSFIETGIQELNRLRSEDVVKGIGMGIKYTHHCNTLLELADFDCFMLQGAFTLLEQPGTEFIARCGRQNTGVFIAGPFASGILASGSVAGGYFHHAPAPELILNKVKKLEATCSDYNVPLSAAALQFPLRNPHVTSVVCGFHDTSQVQQVKQWLALDIPESFWSELQPAISAAS